MTEKHEYAASVRRKGLENTGVTEDIAKKMYGTQGRTTLAIVELRHKRQINDDDTGRSVELVIEALEPSQDPTLDEHLRQLMRTMHQNRVLTADDQQLQIDTAGDVEPSVEKVIAAREAAEAADRPHPYVGDPNGDCDICDAPKGNPIHAELEDLVDEPAEPAEDPVPVA